MTFLFDLATWSIKFYDNIANIYQCMKIKAFENHWIYYAVYDVGTKRYILVYDYDNFLSILFFYIFRYWLGFYMSQLITFNDIATFKHTQLVAIIYYIQNSHDKYIIHNEHTSNETEVGYSVLYAYTDTGEDITHEVEKFKSTIFKSGLFAQDIYNTIMGFKGKKTQKIEYIKYMTDENFNEQVLTAIS